MSTYSFDKEKHLHTLDDKPLTGTSTICKVIAKPLTWWASGKAVEMLGWTKPADWKTLKTEEDKKADKEKRLMAVLPKLLEIREMFDYEYLALLDKAYRAHDSSLDKSATAGTDLHVELEAFVKGRMGKVPVREYDPKITPFIEWADKNVKKFLVSEGNCYSERLWVGGITDCIAELNNGELAIIDFKSSKEAYKSQFIQAAGYAIQIEENGVCDQTGQHCKRLPETTCPECLGEDRKDCNFCKDHSGRIEKKISQLIIVPFGSPRPAPVVMRGVEEFKKAFEAAVVLYRLLENYEE